MQILSHCGNVADAASVAGLAALCHFRRPDVTLRGDEVTVHPPSERDPIPLAVHHHPVCSTFAFFNCRTAVTTAESPKGTARRVVVADPSWQVSRGFFSFIRSLQNLLAKASCLNWSMMNPYESSCLHLRALIFIMKLVKARLLHFASRILSVEPEKLLQNLLAKASCLN